jgi:hypothetical protein
VPTAYYARQRKYKAAVRKLTAKRFPSRVGWVRDHEIPVIEGWKRRIPVDWMASRENVTYMKALPNMAKGRTITKRGWELIDKYNWHRIYNTG